MGQGEKSCQKFLENVLYGHCFFNLFFYDDIQEFKQLFKAQNQRQNSQFATCAANL